MTATLHKLTAGDGYEYLTRQVAAADSTELGSNSLSEYYSDKGESPGIWMGHGLRALETVSAGDDVTQSQMKALYGHGRQPDAPAIEARVGIEVLDRLLAAGVDKKTAVRTAAKAAVAASLLGSPFRISTDATEFRKTVAQRFTEHNLEQGLAWNTAIPDADRARIRTQVGHELFAAEFGRAPVDDRELSGFVARGSRQTTKAVAGYDATCSPVKSVSALWAIAPTPVAAVIKECHDAAVADFVAFLETHAGYTRSGRNGVAQLDTNGLIAAAFTHRDSRAGDPDLHTHVVISNKVQALDGRWLALDGRPLHKWMVAASEHYNTRLETHLRQRLGVRFTERPTIDGKRPVREIVGVSPELCAAWSTRRAVIEVRRGQLATQFQADHGREPTPVEAIALAQQATLETRESKHEPRSEFEQRAAWLADAVQVLGSSRAVSDMVRTALHPARSASEGGASYDEAWVQCRADRIIDTVADHRSTWQISHVRAEAERAARGANADPAAVAELTDRLTTAALEPHRSVVLRPADQLTEPPELRRRDGSSVYTTAGTPLYTSERILGAEQRLVAAAGLRDGHRTSDVAVDLALLESAANGVELNTGQAALVREFATSGARLQLALAPAGTGKTTAMKAFTTAWCNAGGTVLGLAPTGSASAVLRDEIGTTCDTIDKLVDVLDRAEAAQRDGTPVRVPQWVAEIDARTVVIIDEVGLAGTHALDRAVGFVLSRGGQVKMVGDDKQKASVSAGGVIRDIAETHRAVTLSHVMRFEDQAEGAASLALREGDPAAIGFYIDHGRVHVGDQLTAEDLAYSAWAHDRGIGLDAVMMAPTREVVRTLNERARQDRLAMAETQVGREIVLADGLPASVGDTIRTTHNDRRLPITSTDWVRNGYRWRVDAVRDDGGLEVTHLGTQRAITLPSAYVREHTSLGYAATISTSQGITAQTSHTVLTGSETRNDVYVPVTRGKMSNHLYFASALCGDEQSVVTEAALLPRTAVDVFTDVLRRDGAHVSATSLARDTADPRERLAHATDAYLDAVGTAAETLLGPQEMARIDRAADTIHDGLTTEPAWPVLRKHLATLAIDGIEPTAALTGAAHGRELDSAVDAAAVLDFRLDSSQRHSASAGPLPWLGGTPRTLAEHDTWGPYLDTRTRLITDLADRVADTARAWTPSSAPLWARPLAGDHNTQTDTQALIIDLAVWRAAMAVDDSDRRPTGPDRFSAAESRYQKGLLDRTARVLGDPMRAAAHWAPFARRVEPRLLEDPYWPVLADRLTAATRAGIAIEPLAEKLAGRPLPDELPAAALWWRLSRHLSPAVVEASGAPTALLRPHWMPALYDLFDSRIADRVVADASWPALVAAIEDADRRVWEPVQLLAVAHEMILATQGEAPIRPSELAAALTWRVEALLHAPPPLPLDELPAAPHDPEDDEAAAHTAGVVDDPATLGSNPDNHAAMIGDADADYLSSLFDLDPPLSTDEAEAAFDPALAVSVFDLDDDERTVPGEWFTPDAVTIAYADLPIDERVEALRLDAAAADRRVAELLSALHTGTSTHLAAADPIIMSLRARADEQRPYVAAARDADDDWLAADHSALSAEQHYADLLSAHRNHDSDGDPFIEELTAQLETVTDEATRTELTAALDTLRAATAGPNVSEVLDLDLAHQVALDARTTATTARTDADEAQQALLDFAGANGVVEENDVQAARLLADELDCAELNQARELRRRAHNELERAENSAARIHAERTAALIDWTETNSPTTDHASPATHTPRTSAAELTALPRIETNNAAEDMAADPIRMRSDSALSAEIAGLQQQLRSPAIQRSAAVSSEQIRVAHEQLHAQAAAISAARGAESAEIAAAHELRAARSAAEQFRSRFERTPRRRRSERRDLTDQLAATDAWVEDLQGIHLAAVAASYEAREATAIPVHQWDGITTRATDTEALAAELAAAVAADARRTQRRSEEETPLRQRLEAAVAEQARRTELDPQTQDAGNRIPANASTPPPTVPSTRTRAPDQRRDDVQLRTRRSDRNSRRRGPSI